MTAAFPSASAHTSGIPGGADSAPAGPSSAARRIDGLIEILLVALLIFLPAALGTVEPWSELIACVTAAAMAVLLAIRALLSPPARRMTPAAAAIVMFIALALFQLIPLPREVLTVLSPQTVADKTDLLDDLPDAREALSSMTLSFYPLATRRDLRIVLLAVTCFAAARIVFRDPQRIRRLLGVIALVGAAVGMLALAQDVSGARAIYWTIPTPLTARSGPFYHHSHFGQFMNLSIGAALGLLLARLHRPSSTGLPDDPPRVPAKWHRVPGHLVLAGVIVLGLLTIALSLTRGGVVSMLVAGAVTLLVLLSRRGLRWMAVVLVLLAAAAMGGLYHYGFERVADRMMTGGGIGARLIILRDLWQIVRRFPLLGTGLGTFENVFPGYDHTISAGVTSHAENEYAQVAAEMGLVGLALVLAFVLLVAIRYVRAVRFGGAMGAAAVGLGYGLMAVMVHSLSDYGQHLPANAALSAITCGLLFNLGASNVGAGNRGGGPRRLPAPRGVVAAAVVLILLVAGSAITDATRTWLAEKRWSDARRLANRLEARGWDGTADEFAALYRLGDRALAVQPGSAYYAYWQAVYRWHEAAGHRDDVTRLLDETGTALARRSIDLCNRARRLCPTYGEVYTFMGQIEWHYLDLPIGITHIKTGFRLARNDPTAAFKAGEVDALRGRFDEALPAFLHAAALDYTKIYDVTNLYIAMGQPAEALRIGAQHWRDMRHVMGALGLDGTYPEVVTEARSRLIDLLEAECRNPNAPAVDIAYLGGYCADHGRYHEAERHLARALAMEPGNADWRLTRARSLEQLGRRAEALDEARAALRLDPQSSQAKALVERLTP